MGFSAMPRPHLFLRVLLSIISDPRIDRSPGNPTGRGLSGGGSRIFPRRTFLVCAELALVRRQQPGFDGALLARDHRFGSGDLEYWAACFVGGLLPVVPVFRQRRPGFFGLSIGRNAAGSRIPRAVPRASRLAAWNWRSPSPIARQLVPAAVGMVPHLLRVGSRETGER